MRRQLAASLATLVLVTVGWAVPPPAAAVAPVRCHGQVATIVGTPGDDRLVGTPRRDVIVGLGGADRIEGRGGDDVICGGANAGRAGQQLEGDDIDGGPGSNYIDPGQDRRPVADQGTGDILRYSRARTGIRADLTSGTGTVVVGDDTDTIRVAQGLWVLGSQFDDVIVGSRFDDVLEGNRGSDVLRGRGGDDGLDEYTGGLSRTDRHPDRKIGGRGDDSIQANGGADVLAGGAGDDLLYEQAEGTAASMSAGRGNDELWAWFDGAAGRTLDGGAGRDLLEVDNVDPFEPAGAQLVLDASAGVVRSSAASQAPLPAAGVERWRPVPEQVVVFVGGPGADWLEAGMVTRLWAQTFAGADVVKGSYGRDTIDAGNGSDRVDGRGGRDTCLNAERARRCENLSP